jgi:putative membrane protein
MKKNDLFAPQRQSIVAIILILMKYVRMMFRQFWPVLLVLLVNRKGNIETWLGFLFGGIALISLTGSILAYFKFYYFVSEDHLNINKGVLRRVRLNLPFERIQTIDFEQNVVHQLFGVVRVRIDSAGSGGEEISFDALEKDRAEMLRDYVLAQKATLTVESEDVFVERSEEEREQILHLKPMDLQKIGISQNHLRTAGIIFAFFFAIAEDVSDVVKDIDVFDWIGHEVQAMVTGSIIIVLIAIPIFLLISFIVTLFRTIMVHYDLRFWKTSGGFKLTSGLLTRREKSVQRNKIQLISWDTNPLRRLFGIFRLHLFQASSVTVQGNRAMSVPGCYQAHVDNVIASVMPESVDVTYEDHGIHKAARARFIAFAGVLPCVLLTAGGLLFDRYTLMWIWLYFPVAVWMAFLYHRKKRLLLHEDFAIFKSGIFADDWQMLELYKVQAVRVSQSFYQWRKDLATVTLHTASGSVSIPFIPIAKAGQIRDYVLYRVERDGRSWM